MFQYELFRPTYHACSATSGLHVIQARFRFHIVRDLFLPVVQWRLLAGWYHGLISLSFHLAFEIRLRICNELGMQEQIRAGEAESLCRHDHSFLTNTHARAGSRLPSMWNHSRHECCREKADCRDIPTDVPNVGRGRGLVGIRPPEGLNQRRRIELSSSTGWQALL